MAGEDTVSFSSQGAPPKETASGGGGSSSPMTKTPHGKESPQQESTAHTPFQNVKENGKHLAYQSRSVASEHAIHFDGLPAQEVDLDCW